MLDKSLNKIMNFIQRNYRFLLKELCGWIKIFFSWSAFLIKKILVLDRISVVVIRDYRPGVFSKTFSRGIIFTGCSIAVVCLVFLCTIFINYFALKTSVSNTNLLENKIAIQIDERNNQQRQIKLFKDEIESLRTRLTELNKFEKNIRVIANIGSPVNHEGMFGVGGSIPDEFNSQVIQQDNTDKVIINKKNQVAALDLTSVNNEIDIVTWLIDFNDQKNFLTSMPAIRPVEGVITHEFGTRLSSIKGRYELKKGIDIKAEEGISVMASADGIVTYAGPRGLSGSMIAIDHGYGYITRYGNLSEIMINNGDLVKRGDIIALMDKTGRDNSLYLYYEVLLNGVRINPARYILN